MRTSLPRELLAAFDREGDPLDDPGLRAWLLQHPEQLAAFASLRAQLRQLSSMPAELALPVDRSVDRRRRPWWLVASAAGWLAAMLGLWLMGSWLIGSWLIGSTAATSSHGTPLPRPQLASLAAVHSVVVSTQTLGRDGVHERIKRQGRLVWLTSDRHAVAGPAQPNVTSHSIRSVARNLAQ